MNFIKISDIAGNIYNPAVSISELAIEAYSKNPYVSTVINRIANTATYLKLNNELDIFDVETRYKIYVNLLLFGEAFILGIKPTGMNKIKKLEILVNTDVSIMYNETSVFKEITGYKYYTSTFSSAEVLHIKYPSTISNYPKGLSPLNSAQTIYKTSNAIDLFEQYVYQNRGVVGLISGVGDMPLTSTEQDALQTKFQQDTAGVTRAGQIRITPNEVKYTPLTFKPSEMLSTESQLQKLRAVCSIYNVDSSLFNDPANQTYNNVHEANKAFYNNAVLPVSNLVHEKLSNWLIENGTIREIDRIEVDYYDIDALKQDANLDAQAKATYAAARKTFIESIKMEMDLGLLTAEEAKKKIEDSLI